MAWGHDPSLKPGQGRFLLLRDPFWLKKGCSWLQKRPIYAKNLKFRYLSEALLISGAPNPLPPPPLKQTLDPPLGTRNSSRACFYVVSKIKKCTEVTAKTHYVCQPSKILLLNTEAKPIMFSNIMGFAFGIETYGVLPLYAIDQGLKHNGF